MAVLLACFFVAIYLVQFEFDQIGDSEIRDSVEQQFFELELEAENAQPDVPKSIALQDVAIKKAKENINSQADSTKRRQTALSTFMGFYLVNTRTRRAFCREHGVDLTEFSAEFEINHEREMELAMVMVFTQEGSIDKLYKILESQFIKVIEQDMTDLSTIYQVGLKDACELIESNGAEFAKEMLLEKVQPAVFSAIHASN